MKNIIIKKPHSKKCTYVNTKSEFYLPSFKSDLLKRYSRDPFFWGNRAGNKTKIGLSQQWLLMVCNSPECQFQAVINGEVLSDLVRKLK